MCQDAGKRPDLDRTVPVLDQGAKLPHRLRYNLREVELLPSRPRALALDFDGVLTDNTVIVGQDGHEAIVANRGDGMGLDLLRRATALPIVIISTEKNPVVAARAEKLGIPAVHGVEDKLSILAGWCDDRGIDLADVVYVGNDVNDLDCLAAAGCGVVVADGHSAAMARADIVLQSAGGRGAIRELTDLLLMRLKIETQP